MSNENSDNTINLDRKELKKILAENEHLKEQVTVLQKRNRELITRARKAESALKATVEA